METGKTGDTELTGLTWLTGLTGPTVLRHGLIEISPKMGKIKISNS